MYCHVTQRICSVQNDRERQYHSRRYQYSSLFLFKIWFSDAGKSEHSCTYLAIKTEKYQHDEE